MLDPVETAAIATLDDPLRGRLHELVRPSGMDVQVSIPARRYRADLLLGSFEDRVDEQLPDHVVTAR